MSDAGMIRAGRKVIARGQPNASEAGERNDSGDDVSGGESGEHGGSANVAGSAGWEKGRHYHSEWAHGGDFHNSEDMHANAMKAHAAAMAAHSAYVTANGGRGEVNRARNDHLHNSSQQGEMGKMHSDAGQTGGPRDAFSHSGEQGQLGQMRHVPLP